MRRHRVLALADRARIAAALAPLYLAGWTPAGVGSLIELRYRVERSGIPPALDGLCCHEAARWRARMGYLRAIFPALVASEWNV